MICRASDNQHGWCRCCSAINLYTKDALMGKTLNPEEPVDQYKCDEARIANPDNVNFIKVGRQL